MVKPSRNDPCPCGSSKKYKKCCLNRGIILPEKTNLTPGKKPILVKTLTDELFQPMRLYYTIFDIDQLKLCLQQLRCIYYDSELNDWTLRYEAEAANISLNVPSSQTPAKARPLVIATIYLENGEMLIDVRSIERASRIIEFIDKYISCHIAKITHTAIYNKLVTALYPESAKEIIFQESQEKSKKPLPEVEKAPIYYYEEGIGFFEMACRFRHDCNAALFGKRRLFIL